MNLAEVIFPPAPPDHDDIPCVGYPSEWWTEYDERPLRRIRGQEHPLPEFPTVWAALQRCGICSPATREWCLNDAVQPTRSTFTGIAGGIVWVRGQIVFGKPGIGDVHLCKRRLHLLAGRQNQCRRCETPTPRPKRGSAR